MDKPTKDQILKDEWENEIVNDKMNKVIKKLKNVDPEEPIGGYDQRGIEVNDQRENEI